MFFMLKIFMKSSSANLILNFFFPALGWGSGLGTGFNFGIRYEKVRFYKLKIPTIVDVVPHSLHQNENEGSISRVTTLVHNLE